ncbi:uncharacterized protein LOC105420969 [Amborella trichopoda]|uniref:uncharacterized protein LOC105420969 n=1 Tax=Amborella trichopoda TaxID=13333 RepID=UPI0005D2F27A|nr:uncharacterized protein LOC105420969 [Amborella trichopoda]|eukprot:XP_011624971.1 uncharacterized protein LOC105420969 [Amborella trichopoda]
MATKSFIAEILKTVIFDGTNYASWKRKIGYSLYEEGLNNILIEASPSQPRINAPQAIRDAYVEWEHKNMLPKHNILMSIHYLYASEYEAIKTMGMHDRLEMEFVDPSLMRKTLAMKKYNDLKMAKGEKIADHMHTFRALV